MESVDIECIMNQLKTTGDEQLKSDNANSGRSSRQKGKPDDGDDNCLKEVPPYILQCFKILVTNLTEREDNKRKEMEEEFDRKLAEKLAEKDEIISELEKKV